MLNITIHQRKSNQNLNEILPHTCQNVYKSNQPLWKTVCRFHKILKIELSYNPTIPLLGIHPRKTKTLMCSLIFIEALFTIAKI